MTTQTTFFPKTELDEATAVLAHLISEEEKADKASDAAGQKAADTASRVRKQRHVVAKLQDMMPAAEPIVDGETAVEDIEDAEILQTEGDVLDPITGEVTSKADAVNCDTCGRDCNLCQRKGSGHTGCGGDSWAAGGPEPQSRGAVHTFYPGEKHSHITDVGSRTQYAELVADYLATLPAVSLHRNDPVEAYRVIGIDDEIDRDLHSAIALDDYGQELAVVRLADVQEANELLEDAVR